MTRHTASEDRITSSCWVAEYIDEIGEADVANPSVFNEPASELHADGSTENSVPLPSIDPALHLSWPSSRTSTIDEFRLSSLDSMRVESEDFQRLGSNNEWLEALMTSASTRATTKPSERFSSVDLVTKTLLGEEEPTLEHEAEEQTESVQLADAAAAKPSRTSPTRPKSDGRVCVTEVRRWDILSEKGGKGNNHDGNKRFHKLVTQLKEQYREIETKQVKTAFCRAIVSYVKGYGGRFLKKDSDGRYNEMMPSEARKKTSQCIRENKDLKWTRVAVEDEVVAFMSSLTDL